MYFGQRQALSLSLPPRRITEERDATVLSEMAGPSTRREHGASSDKESGDSAWRMDVVVVGDGGMGVCTAHVSVGEESRGGHSPAVHRSLRVCEGRRQGPPWASSHREAGRDPA
mmetsp:Transcript_32114/g.91063  ORF Transcript_32114/g.91063 Transcript_32114/m.91063 type:complete len:114 (-) Transcript_32114:145-486(-)